MRVPAFSRLMLKAFKVRSYEASTSGLKFGATRAQQPHRELRILHVVPTYLPATRYGGPIFAVHNLARGLAARGHDIEVFTTNVDGTGHSDVILNTPVLLDGVKVSYFASNHLRRLYWSPTLGAALDRDVRSFDVLHLHSVFLWPTWYAARSAEGAHVPYLVSPRGMLVRELIRRRSPRIKMLWITMFERKTLRQAAAIHVTSELEGEELRRFGWQLPHIVTIGNGVEDPKRIAEREVASDIKDVSRHQPLVLFLGRLSWKKGVDRLLEAFALTEAGHLVVAGTDEERLSLRLAQQAERLGISHRVTILARTVDGSDKEHLFAAAQVFVLPSYSENFGNTVLEAMRRGLPVVVTPEVGAADIVHQAGGGMIIAGDAQALGQALSALISDRALARNMGELGRRHVLSRYGWPAIAESMEGLYRAIIEQS
jgi:glycosyltransferase involved in cell wall biosynthesis